MANCIPLPTMKSLIVPFVVLLLLTSLASLTFASKLKNLLLYKYRDHLLPQPDIPNLDDMLLGTAAFPIIPISFERSTLTNPDYLQLLDNFEQNPEAVFYEIYVERYAFQHAVRDFSNDETSRQIIFYYKEIGLADEYVEALIYHAFRFNSPEVIELFMDFIESYNAAGRQGHYKGSTWMNGAIEGASFNILESLIIKGIYIVPPTDMVFAICRLLNVLSFWTNSGIEKAIDFLVFLIRLRNEVDVNERFLSNGRTPLLECLMIIPTKPADQKKIVNALIKLGANPYMTNGNGKSAITLAMERNIELAGF